MFSENAAIKARAATEATGLPAFADDSGLCVDALDGAPGLFSARWSGGSKDFSGAMARIERELSTRGATNRRSHFVSALVLTWPDGHEELFEGRCSASWSGRRAATRASATTDVQARREPAHLRRAVLGGEARHRLGDARGAVAPRPRLLALAAACLRRPE